MRTHVRLRQEKYNFKGVVSWCPLLEAILHCKELLGARILSTVRNREASASRRLFKYCNYGNFNP